MKLLTAMSATVAVSKPKPPALGPETTELLKRATKGDKGCLPEVRALLADRRIRAKLAGVASVPRPSGSGRTSSRNRPGKTFSSKRPSSKKLDTIQAELEGPNPTPIERLLAERASLCWFIVHRYENAYANSEGWTIAQADLQHRKIDKAHARFLSALRTLAQVRKLALPTLQVNIGKNQVNVAETRS